MLVEDNEITEYKPMSASLYISPNLRTYDEQILVGKYSRKCCSILDSPF